MPLNRLVAFVLGPVITLASGYISLWLSRNFPGAHLPDQQSVAGVLTTGVVTVVPMILAHAKIQKWLKGWQDWEKRADEATHGALDEALSGFLERIAAKTGVPLPTGETLPPDAAEGTVVGADTGTVETPDMGGPPAPPTPPAAQPDAFPPADRP